MWKNVFLLLCIATTLNAEVFNDSSVICEKTDNTTLRFTVLGTPYGDFVLNLVPIYGVFHKDFKYSIDGIESEEFDTTAFFEGQLDGDSSSEVVIYIGRGPHVTGMIRSERGVFGLQMNHTTNEVMIHDFSEERAVPHILTHSETTEYDFAETVQTGIKSGAPLRIASHPTFHDLDSSKVGPQYTASYMVVIVLVVDRQMRKTEMATMDGKQALGNVGFVIKSIEIYTKEPIFTAASPSDALVILFVSGKFRADIMFNKKENICKLTEPNIVVNLENLPEKKVVRESILLSNAIGHSFGTLLDNRRDYVSGEYAGMESECGGGRYLMNCDSKEVLRRRKMFLTFSPCSRQEMLRTLQTYATCFIDRESSTIGVPEDLSTCDNLAVPAPLSPNVIVPETTVRSETITVRTETEVKPVPTEVQPAPAVINPVSTDVTTVPTEVKPVPTEVKPVATEATTVATEVKPAPTEVKPVPTDTATVRIEATTVATEAATTVATEAATTVATEVEPVPTDTATVRLEATTAATEATTVATEVKTAPTEVKPVPTDTATVRIEATTAATEATTVATEFNPAPTDTVTVRIKATPVATEVKPVPTDTATVRIEVATEVKPVATEVKPVATEVKPVPTDTATIRIEATTVATEVKPATTETTTIPGKTETVSTEAKTVPKDTTAGSTTITVLTDKNNGSTNMGSMAESQFVFELGRIVPLVALAFLMH